MTPTEPQADFTRACLVRWGEWLRAGGGLVQGYAHETPVGRFRREGAVIRGQGRSGRLDDDPLAEHIDRIVSRLRQDDRRWPLMMAVYFGGGQDATYAFVARVLAGKFGEPVAERSVRDWMREAIATVRGELRGWAESGG